MSKKKFIYPVLYGVALTGFTAYALLDTFVITRSYQTTVESNFSASDTYSSVFSTSSSSLADESSAADSSVSESTDASSSESAQAEESESSQTDTQSEDSSASSQTVVSTDSYSDKNITITLTEYREYDTSIYVADITLTSAEYLKTAFAENTYGRNIKEKTSEIAESVGAILAINGDFYGAQSEGYVIRNGILYRSDAAENNEDLAILTDGSFQIFNESDYSAESVLSSGAWQTFAFGPALVQGGEIAVTEDEEVGKSMASNPRTAIVSYGGLHYAFVVSDGRTSESEGLSLYQLAEFLQSIGAQTAYNLDGGGSSTMYFNGEVVNNPTTNGKKIKERSVSDIVYIGY